MKSKLDEHFIENYDRYLQIAKNLNNKIDDPYDILQECICEVYCLPETKLVKIFSYLHIYFIQMLKYSSFSKTSKYQRKYNSILTDRNQDVKMLLENATDEINIYDEITIEDVNEILNNECNWYEKDIFYMYTKSGKTFKQMSEDTKIPVTSLFYTYSKVKRTLKTKLIKKYEEKD